MSHNKNDGKFKKEYLRKLERNWENRKEKIR